MGKQMSSHLKYKELLSQNNIQHSYLDICAEYRGQL